MKKKISLFICIFILALSFTACGSKDKGAKEYEEETLEQIADTVIGSFTQMTEQDFDQFEDGSELEVNLTLMQSGLPVDRDAFIGMINAWKAADKDCGMYVGHSDYEVKQTNTGVTLTTNAEFEQRKATIAIAFDEKLKMESMTVDATYSTGEILKKAGLNTVLGMGTVFVLLIFIAIIISLFKYIPVLQDIFSKKPDQIPVNEQPIVEPLAAAAAEQVDDLEVVAAITAVIAATMGTSKDGFVVRSIKRRISNKWN